ncbi:6897_t:CDS:2 [Cetraspora pellucida]|uniref:6897_t:CDS:1 n=1 Tax=Cetraspora pellucida TaxID=1433469 RepID=A0A9N8VGW7_9GLOM|nr:6897_t:CDS:2 [Cetraspora pellucida]
MNIKCRINNNFKICNYKKQPVVKPYKPTKEDELLELFILGLAVIQHQKSDNAFNRLKKKIQDTYELEELKENRNLDKEIQSSNLDEKQKNELQTIRINQERMILRYNKIKEGIKEETEVDHSQNLIQKLKDELQELKKKRLEFLENYIKEFNRFLQEIQNKKDLGQLKDFWIKEIDKSIFTEEDKQKLHDLREDHIRELEQS